MARRPLEYTNSDCGPQNIGNAFVKTLECLVTNVLSITDAERDLWRRSIDWYMLSGFTN